MSSPFADRIKKMARNRLFRAVHPELTLEEKAAVNAYTDEQYKNVNAFLRGKKFSAKHKKTLLEIADILSSALSKMKPYYTGTCYRGTDLDDIQIQIYRDAANAGEKVTHAFFTSSSADPALAFEGNTTYIIKSKTGADVTTLSIHPAETEILFNKGVSFVVTLVKDKDATGKTYIYLEEA